MKLFILSPVINFDQQVDKWSGNFINCWIEIKDIRSNERYIEFSIEWAVNEQSMIYVAWNESLDEYGDGFKFSRVIFLK